LYSVTVVLEELQHRCGLERSNQQRTIALLLIRKNGHPMHCTD
jgi:hypothetical protein